MVRAVVLEVLKPHALPPDALAELTEVVEEEASSFGSASDVHDAVGHLLPPDDAAALSNALFDAIKAKRGPGRARVMQLPATEPVPSTEAESGTEEPGPSGAGVLERLSWAREYKSHAERFERPFVYEMEPPGTTLTLQQAPFDAEGFASTVWDSAIVLAKVTPSPNPKPNSNPNPSLTLIVWDSAIALPKVTRTLTLNLTLSLSLTLAAAVVISLSLSPALTLPRPSSGWHRPWWRG